MLVYVILSCLTVQDTHTFHPITRFCLITSLLREPACQSRDLKFDPQHGHLIKWPNNQSQLSTISHLQMYLCFLSSPEVVCLILVNNYMSKVWLYETCIQQVSLSWCYYLYYLFSPKPYTGVENLCSMTCPGMEGIPPHLHCNVCQCLFHNECVNYFSDSAQFVCLVGLQIIFTFDYCFIRFFL